ncbi:hypothetical protein MRB53_025709 [Persea americana]|uniref:Uncharacterized protein n=1 Tax=Persea americana TaxID=3435 RepID=A0ACC2LGR6_PERAE|nr:hypothetical protein MRB53_025709 [Persea americana]
MGHVSGNWNSIRNPSPSKPQWLPLLYHLQLLLHFHIHKTLISFPLSPPLPNPISPKPQFQPSISKAPPPPIAPSPPNPHRPICPFPPTPPAPTPSNPPSPEVKPSTASSSSASPHHRRDRRPRRLRLRRRRHGARPRRSLLRPTLPLPPLRHRHPRHPPPPRILPHLGQESPRSRPPQGIMFPMILGSQIGPEGRLLLLFPAGRRPRLRPPRRPGFQVRDW